MLTTTASQTIAADRRTARLAAAHDARALRAARAGGSVTQQPSVAPPVIRTRRLFRRRATVAFDV